MIRARNALSRQAQEFFHSHLLGLYRWDDVDHSPAQDVVKERGKPWEAGKTHDTVEMRFGPFALTVAGPFEAPPCGSILIETGRDKFEGPLDPATWDKVAQFVKDHDSEEYHGVEAGSDWGRGAG